VRSPSAALHRRRASTAPFISHKTEKSLNLRKLAAPLWKSRNFTIEERGTLKSNDNNLAVEVENAVREAKAREEPQCCCVQCARWVWLKFPGAFADWKRKWWAMLVAADVVDSLNAALLEKDEVSEPQSF
jgi:hypothetical protein|tara:strand:+ start:152 stop:541 length:390 start_codon:yes stop_codon:yes gene_type:complete